MAKIKNLFLCSSEKYVVIGARRDAWGPGFASSTVGTSVMVELARAVTEMINQGETLSLNVRHGRHLRPP